MSNILDDFSEEQKEGDQFQKYRHGCATVWLVLMLVANSLTALVYTFAGERIADRLATVDIQNWMLALLALAGLGNVLFAILLFRWKKLGFWGFVGSTILANAVNLQMGLGLGSVLSGLIGIGVLFFVLRLEEDGVSTWDHLD